MKKNLNKKVKNGKKSIYLCVVIGMLDVVILCNYVLFLIVIN